MYLAGQIWWLRTHLGIGGIAGGWSIYRYLAPQQRWYSQLSFQSDSDGINGSVLERIKGAPLWEIPSVDRGKLVGTGSTKEKSLSALPNNSGGCRVLCDWIISHE